MDSKFDKLHRKLIAKYGKKETEMGLDVEKEHGDVTKGDPVKIAKIAAAHLKEKPNYYKLLKKYVENN